MKKLFFLIIILILFCFKIYAKDFTIIKGKVIDKKENVVNILDSKTSKMLQINLDKEIENIKKIKKGELVKIFLDNTGKIVKIKKFNIFKIRERIKRIGRFKEHGSHGRNRGFHRGRR